MDPRAKEQTARRRSTFPPTRRCDSVGVTSRPERAELAPPHGSGRATQRVDRALRSACTPGGREARGGASGGKPGVAADGRQRPPRGGVQRKAAGLLGNSARLAASGGRGAAPSADRKISVPRAERVDGRRLARPAARPAERPAESMRPTDQSGAGSYSADRIDLAELLRAEPLRPGQHRSPWLGASTGPLSLRGYRRAVMRQTRQLLSPRHSRCGIYPLADLQVVERSAADGARSLAVQGHESCSDRWCIACRPRALARQLAVIGRALEGRRERAAFVTLTMRHTRGMSYALQVAVLKGALRRMWGGREGQRAHTELGGPDSIWCPDQTFSPVTNAHAHYHGVLFFDTKIPRKLEKRLAHRWAESLRATVRAMLRGIEKAEGKADPQAYLDRLFGRVGRGLTLDARLERLSEEVAELTEDSVQPSEERGVKAERLKDSQAARDYLCKLGLELTHSGAGCSVDSRGVPHYSIPGLLELLTDVTHRHHRWARNMVREAWEATRGLSWIQPSRGLYSKFRINEPTERELEDAELEGVTERLLGVVSAKVWNEAARRLGGGDAVHELLESMHERGELERALPQVGMCGIARPAVRRPPVQVDTAATRAHRRQEAADRAARAKERPPPSEPEPKLRVRLTGRERRERLEELRHVLWLDCGLLAASAAMSEARGISQRQPS